MEQMRRDDRVRDLYLRHVELVALLGQTAESRAAMGTMPISEEMLGRAKRNSALSALAYGLAAVLLLGAGLMFFSSPLRLRAGRAAHRHAKFPGRDL